MTSKSSLRTPLAKVRGLGSAKSGVGHWWWQRVTAVALIPLGIWFVYGLIGVITAGDRTAVVNWIHSPVVAIGLALFVTALFTHAKLGLQVVIEDYVHGHALRISLIMITKFATIALIAVTILSILKIHLS